MYGGYAFNNQWMLTARADWLSADIGDVEGDLLRFGARILYQPFEHLGFGAGYDYLDANVTVKDGEKRTAVDGVISGPALFVTMTFF